MNDSQRYSDDSVDPCIGPRAFKNTFFANVNQSKLTVWFENTAIVNSFVQLFVGNLVDCHAASHPLKQIPTGDNLAPSIVDNSLEHLGLGT